MSRKTIIIKNVSEEVADMLRTIRLEERRQLAAILEDAVTDYWQAVYEVDAEAVVQ